MPDIVCLAKAISGYGLPMALVLINPEYDQWAPGEHNGTFRGNNLAFVTAARAIEMFWSDDSFERSVNKTAQRLRTGLNALTQKYGGRAKGRGMMLGIDVKDKDICARIRTECFHNGLIVEACGAYDEVVKLLPPLNIGHDDLAEGLNIMGAAFESQLDTRIEN